MQQTFDSAITSHKCQQGGVFSSLRSQCKKLRTKIIYMNKLCLIMIMMKKCNKHLMEQK